MTSDGLFPAVDIAIYAPSKLVSRGCYTLDLLYVRLLVWTNAKRILRPRAKDMPCGPVNSHTTPNEAHWHGIAQLGQTLQDMAVPVRHLVLASTLGKRTINALWTKVLGTAKNRFVLEIGLDSECAGLECDGESEQSARSHSQTKRPRIDADNQKERRQTIAPSDEMLQSDDWCQMLSLAKRKIVLPMKLCRMTCHTSTHIPQRSTYSTWQTSTR